MVEMPFLNPGDTIGVFAPSSYIEKADIEAAVSWLSGRGYKTVIHPQTFMRHHQSAGTSADKAAAFKDLILDPKIKAIWAAGGGNRCLHWLDRIDWTLLQNQPKPVMGFSDTTALLNAIYAQCGFSGLHAPLFRQLPMHGDALSALDMLAGRRTQTDLSGARILQNGEAHGPVIGGCLSVFQALIGTPYLPDTKGAILCLEDAGDHLSRFDRMFAHLRQAGILSSISALLCGTFTDLQDGSRPFGFTLEDIIRDQTHNLAIPVVMDAPFGHGPRLAPLKIGKTARFSTADLQLQYNP